MVGMDREPVEVECSVQGKWASVAKDAACGWLFLKFSVRGGSFFKRIVEFKTRQLP